LVGGLLLLVALLVGGSLGIEWGALLLAQGLPLLSENLADLACTSLATGGADMGRAATHRT
jgi:hypothetical protein